MQDTPKDDVSKPRPEMNNLLSTRLAATDNLEVVVSRVKVPVGVELPMHYHPGEEFAYVIEGTITLKLKDDGDTDYSAGDAAVVPCRAVHTICAKKPAELIVFRVHDKGQPVRVVVKPDGQEIPLDK